MESMSGIYGRPPAHHAVSPASPSRARPSGVRKALKMLGWRDMVSKLGVRCVIEVKSGWRVAGELGKRRFSRGETEP